MRNGQNKRMRGRNNNNNNRKGGHYQNPLSRMYESNGQDVKIRGTASHIAEKYLQLARDAQSSGDTIASENYYQHAEHYFRLIAAAQEQLRQNQPSFQQQPGDNRGNSSEDGYDDGDDEQPHIGGEPFAPRDPQFYPREPQQHQPQQYQPQQSSRSSTSRNNISRSINRTRSSINRGRSSTPRRPTTATSNVCRHSLPAASRSISRRPNRAMVLMAPAGSKWAKWPEWL